MPNPWIQHVQAYAASKGMTYFQALRDPKVKEGYKKKVKGGGSLEEARDPQREARLWQRIDSLLNLAETLEDNYTLTPMYANMVRRDVYQLANNTTMPISAKHDALTNILKDIRAITDERYYGKVQPHAF